MLDVYLTFSKYISSAVYGLDFFIEYRYSYEPNYMGIYTLPGINLFLEKLGIINFQAPALHGEMFNFRGDISNLYTGLYFPILDFGILGLLITRVFLGLAYGLFTYLMKASGSFLLFIVYPVLLFPSIFGVLGDLYINFQQFNFFYFLIVIVIIIKIFFREE